MTKNRINRRQALKVAGSTGISSLAVVGNVSALTHRITTIKSGETPLQRKDVPLDWWEQMEKVSRVRENLQKQFESETGVRSIALTTREKTISERKAGRVEVEIVPEKTPPTIPESVEGVKVSVREHQERELDSCNQSQFDPVKGGVVGGETTSDTGPTWTCRVHDGSSKRMLHCAHTFDVCNETGIIGQDAHQRNQVIGEVMDLDASRDISITRKTSDMDVNGYSNRIEDATGELKGRMTKSGLKDLMSNDTEVYKVGRRTCRTGGEVEKLNVESGLDCADQYNQEYVKCTMNTESGDSGAPYFHEAWDPNLNEYYIAMIGVHSGGTSVGCSAYDIHNTYGYEFH